MTKRDFLQLVSNGEMNEEIMAFAHAEIEKMDAANEKRKARPSKTSVENAPIIEALTQHLTGEPQVASDLAKLVEISTQKASSLLRKMVEDGVAVSTEVKGKKGKVKGYAKAGE